jgi:hypothetical protein
VIADSGCDNRNQRPDCTNHDHPHRLLLVTVAVTCRTVQDDDILNEDWIKNRMVRSHRLLSLVLVAIGFGRRISKRNKMKRGSQGEQLGDGIELCGEQMGVGRSIDAGRSTVLSTVHITPLALDAQRYHNQYLLGYWND